MRNNDKNEINEAIIRECKVCCSIVPKNIKDDFCCYRCREIYEEMRGD